MYRCRFWRMNGRAFSRANSAMDRRFANRAAGRVREVEAVVRLPVVVAGGPEADRDPQDQQARAQPRWHVREQDQRREQRRQVAIDLDVLRPEERTPEDAAERQVPGADREDEALDDRVDRPAILPGGLPESLRGRAPRLAERAEHRALDGHARALAGAARRRPKPLDHRVGELAGAGGPAEVGRRRLALGDDAPDRALDALTHLGVAQVPEHQCARQDERRRVGLVLAGVLGRRAVDRLEYGAVLADVRARRDARGHRRGPHTGR